MSPVSRGRNGRKKKSSRRTAPPEIIAAEPCDCAACTGEDIDPEQLLDDLMKDSEDLGEAADPLEAEVGAAALLAIGEPAGEEFQQALLAGFIPRFEERASIGATAMLLGLAAVAGDDRVAKAASDAVHRSVTAGVSPPGWMDEFAEPVTAGEFSRLSDPLGMMSLLIGSFQRAGRSHAFVIGVNHLECGAAADILLAEGDNLPNMLAEIRSNMRGEGMELTQEFLDPAEFRWEVENALDARAVHDEEQPLPTADESNDQDDDGLDYPTMSVLLRARLATLPPPAKPATGHRDHHAAETLTELLASVQEMAGVQGIGGLQGFPGLQGPGGLPGIVREEAELPPAPARPEGTAPIYRIKVGLRGAKPPIWRRLEVPADVTLADLHEILQVAFEWHDSHLHVFETPYGNFGTPDPELGHHPEGTVTLEQVAPEEKSKLTYLYDFGDDWEHQIVVEKLLDPDPATTYPRCTGGRRAAPPEDCGGIWGYAWLLDILNDPTHPEHNEQVEWLGLDQASDLDPAQFDAAAITRDLAVLR